MPKLLNPVPIDNISTQGATKPIWINWFNAVASLLNRAPTIYEGEAAPTSIPQKIGDTYIDTLNQDVYVSTGTSNSSDWKKLN